MMIKHFVLATSTILLVAIAGQAYAGTTISDRRYWPSEVNAAADQTTVRRSENAFDSTEMPRGVEATGRSYQGGPKSDY
jgi:hypothetical protein